MATITQPRTPFAIDGDATIYAASDLFERIKAVLQGSGTIELDLAHVTEIDTAGVQLLLLLKREADLAQRPLRLLGASPPVREVLRMLDLRAALRG